MTTNDDEPKDEAIETAEDAPPKARRAGGFRALSPERRREIASMGGCATRDKGTAHRFTPEELSRGGKRGGAVRQKKRRAEHEAGGAS